MRVHSLSLTAFGPFADTVEVDFDDAGRDYLPPVGPDRRGQDDAARRGRLRPLRHGARSGRGAPAAQRPRRRRRPHRGGDVRGHPVRRADPRDPAARAAAAQARQRVDDRAAVHRPALGSRHAEPVDRRDRRGRSTSAPGWGSPPSSSARWCCCRRAIRPLPARRAGGPWPAAAHALRRRPVRPRRGVAGRRAGHGPHRPGDEYAR